MKNFKKLLLICLVAIIAVGCSKKETPDVENNNFISKEEEIINYSEIYSEEIKNIKELKAINGDFLGILNLGETIISNEIVVKDMDNNEYIHKDFFTGDYSIYGTTFMDYRNSKDFDSSKNIIIYGHYVYPGYRDGIHINFTNLSELISEENYELNKGATLLTEKGIREYVLASIYYINENDLAISKGPLYYITDFTEDEFEAYKSEIKNAEFYSTGVKLDYNDKLLTLQTCVENRSELRLVAVLKEINRIEF